MSPPALDPAELARDLAKTTANLKRHIADEARARAAKLGVQYAKAAQEQIDVAKADARRWQDCNTELRRQMKPLERMADRSAKLIAAIRTASWDGNETVELKTLLDIINSPEKPHAPDHQA